jgi:hypothetical protein
MPQTALDERYRILGLVPLSPTERVDDLAIGEVLAPDAHDRHCAVGLHARRAFQALPALVEKSPSWRRRGVSRRKEVSLPGFFPV